MNFWIYLYMICSDICFISTTISQIVFTIFWKHIYFGGDNHPKHHKLVTSNVNFYYSIPLLYHNGSKTPPVLNKHRQISSYLSSIDIIKER